MSRERHYTSNIAPAWPIEDQRAMLNGKGRRYEDVLKRAALKSHGTKMLVQRAEMLRATQRTSLETIHVASLACLARSALDLAHVLALAAARHAIIFAHDIQFEIPPDAGAVVISQALQAFDTSKRRVETEGGRRKGVEVSVANREADTARRIALIAADWRQRNHTTAELLLRAGQGKRPMAYNTAIKHLGSRARAQKQGDDHAAYLLRKEDKSND